MAQNKTHFYLLAILASYTREGNFKQRHFNLFVESDERQLVLNDFNQARLTIVQKLYEELEVKVEDVHDLTFLSASYLGFMSPKVFKGAAPERDTKASPFDA